jgi:bifunctional enzyme CysN/CysC
MAEQELLRFLTAGSVDDGKSTLIGRLLHDANSIYEDQLASLRAASPGGGTKGETAAIDFSLLTDGLRAEREQGITIDVAYRSFSTPRRRFIIADTPGHEQYTRNMATGASTASLAVLLIDARKGVLPQTRRHGVIAWLLGIRSFAVAVNKMDLAGFDEQVFRNIERDFMEFSSRLDGAECYFIPICSIDGDNVVTRSARTPWFHGQTLLEYLETVPVATGRSLEHVRLPVQYVLRSPEARRYAGALASGILHKGDPVRVLPSGQMTRIASIHLGDCENADREIEAASPPLSISIALADELDISRGDMLVDPASPPAISRRFAATLVWMDHQPLEMGRPYLLKHTTRTVCASVTRIRSAIDPATLQREPADRLSLNQFGEVEIETHQPLYFDPYSENRVTGAFIMIDPIANGTLGAGMIAGASSLDPPYSQDSKMPAASGAGLTVWFTGLSSAGKSTISQAVHEKLWAMGYKVELLDGDVVRQHLNRGLGFSKEDRDENVRRIGFVAELLTRNGVIALVSAISPYRSIRDEIRQKIGNFLEVYVHAPLEVCEQRDLKGIYRRARAGEMRGVTGVDDPYEPPLAAEVQCHTDRETPLESAARVLQAVLARLAHNVDQKAPGK